MKKVNICGVTFKIKEVDVIDEGESGITQGQIIYHKAKILLKRKLPKTLKKQVLFHEILHGILTQLGYSELSENETLVQALSTALYQIFDFKKKKAESEE